VLAVSDHGAKPMMGGVCFNEWLIREGYLTLRTAPTEVTKLTPEMVDWTRARAWGDGGYYGRLFLNVEGREPAGTVPEADVEALRDEIAAKLEALGDEHGRAIGTRVYRPDRIYADCRGVPPDLIVYFGDLNWRSIGTVGHGTLWTHTNDTGPDDANHAQHGMAIMSTLNPQHSTLNEYRTGMSIYDIAPTILRAFGIEPPSGMGHAAIELEAAEDVYSAEEEAEIARRLEELGYL
jgi:predicted AlkP superfamily phosphohydrolase/phosphomutase